MLRREALLLGFGDMGVTRADLAPLMRVRLMEALQRGYHGDMAWMDETAVRRSHPRELWPGARSVLVFAMAYGPKANPLITLEESNRATISVYARNRDYHDVIKGRLKILASKLCAKAGGDVKVFVDTAPVMEKPLAQAAGLGWQGKHTNLVSQRLGSWFFLGEIFTTLDLVSEDLSEKDHCGSCRRCLDICPTQAFPAPYQLDARRCISYLTIEHKGHIDKALRPLLGNRIYGCDDCLAVCPWNKFAGVAHETKLIARDDLMSPSLAALAKLDDAAFRQMFSGSPIKRIGRDRFMRNVLIAIGNSNNSELADAVLPHLEDQNAIVRVAAIWAYAHIASPFAVQEQYERYFGQEIDSVARNEWQDIHL